MKFARSTLAQRACFAQTVASSMFKDFADKIIGQPSWSQEMRLNLIQKHCNIRYQNTNWHPKHKIRTIQLAIDFYTKYLDPIMKQLNESE